MKEEIDLKTLSEFGNRPKSDVEQEVLRTLRALDAIARTTRLYSVSGSQAARSIQRRAMRSIKYESLGEFVLLEEDNVQ